MKMRYWNASEKRKGKLPRSNLNGRISYKKTENKRERTEENQKRSNRKQLCLDVGRGLCLIARIIIVLIIPVCNLICEGICI